MLTAAMALEGREGERERERERERGDTLCLILELYRVSKSTNVEFLLQVWKLPALSPHPPGIETLEWKHRNEEDTSASSSPERALLVFLRKSQECLYVAVPALGCAVKDVRKERDHAQLFLRTLIKNTLSRQLEGGREGRGVREGERGSSLTI